MPPRRPLLAAGIAFLFPGGGHFHARRPWTGLLVGTTLVCGWISRWGSSSRESFAGEMLFGSLVALVFVDAIAGRRAAMAENRGIHPGQARQFARGIVMMACAAAAGAAVRDRGRDAALAGGAANGAVRDATARRSPCASATATTRGACSPWPTVVLHTETSSSTPGAAYRVGRDAWTQLEIRAGDAGLVDFSLTDELRELCIAEGCDLTYALEASRPGDTSVSPLSGEGVCEPSWDQPGTVTAGTDRAGGGRVTDAPTLVVRAAVPADAAAMAALHVHAWRAAYAGVMPADFLASLTIAEREAMWRRSVTEPELAPAERVILVAAEGEQVLGFCTAGHARGDDELGLGELYALNVDPPAWGRGAGRALLAAAATWLDAPLPRLDPVGRRRKPARAAVIRAGGVVARRRRQDGGLRRHRRQALPVPVATDLSQGPRSLTAVRVQLEPGQLHRNLADSRARVVAEALARRRRQQDLAASGDVFAQL